MQVAIENHHPDKKNKPTETVSIPHKTHQNLHGISPLDTPLSRKMHEYDKVNTILVSMKNWSIAYQKDFDKTPNIGLEYTSQLKKTLAKELAALVKSELPKVKHIKGFGPCYLAGILAYAHPSRFPSLHKFLFYCGYTMVSRETKKYCRRIKPIMYNLVGSAIKAKDPKYYALYLKLKEDAKTKYPAKSKMKYHMIAINRTATFILKEVYQIWRAEK